MKILMTILKVQSGYYFETNNFKGTLLCKKKNAAGVMVLILYTSSDSAIYTKFHENILDGIKVIAQTRFSLEKFQSGTISQKL